MTDLPEMWPNAPFWCGCSYVAPVVGVVSVTKPGDGRGGGGVEEAL